ncbi:hypothetical protein BGZ96_012656 [Linnemannia gamsii]|uniref:Uncharacterized protein n=1 Tax=Linnemannia gamsii TaxID=64522 RepID=A0ABQ7JQV7_9FUNG|nr:hypothetical protein BGZ96_012656 [Linnemannia gamsii]
MLFMTNRLLILFTTLSLSQQQFACAQQQQPTGTTSAADPVPTFDNNTPGIYVQSPVNGVSIHPEGILPIALAISSRRPVSLVVATIAKPDGSGNTTVLEYKPMITLRIMTAAPLAKFKLAEGDYIVTLAITPNLTAPSGNATATTTIAAPAPNPTIPINLPDMYYWHGAIKISKEAHIPNGGEGGASKNNAAPGSGAGAVVVGVMATTGAWATLANMMAALGVLAFVNVVVL